MAAEHTCCLNLSVSLALLIASAKGFSRRTGSQLLGLRGTISPPPSCRQVQAWLAETVASLGQRLPIGTLIADAPRALAASAKPITAHYDWSSLSFAALMLGDITSDDGQLVSDLGDAIRLLGGLNGPELLAALDQGREFRLPWAGT